MSGDVLSGGLPTWISNLNRLVVLNLDSTHIGGSIPSEIGKLATLRCVNSILTCVESLGSV